MTLLTKRRRAYPVFVFIDGFLVASAYSAALGLKVLDPLVGDARLFWTDLLISLPVIIGVHPLTNVLAGASRRLGAQSVAHTTGALVAANVLSGCLVLVLSLFARSGLHIVIPYSVIIVGTALSLSLMVLARLLSRSRQCISQHPHSNHYHR